MSARPVPVPDAVTIAYVVLTDAPLDRSDDVPLPDDSLLRLRGSGPEAVTRIAALPHRRLVARTVGAGAARLAAEEVRREALAIAHRHGGLVIDLQTPRIVDEAASDDPLPAARWFVFGYDPRRPGELRTHGLGAVGLPEVLVREVPVDQRPVYDMVVVGLAHRLLEEWPGNDPVGPAHVTLADIAAGYGTAAPAADDVAGVDILIDYEAESESLVVHAMADPRAALFDA